MTEFYLNTPHRKRLLRRWLVVWLAFSAGIAAIFWLRPASGPTIPDELPPEGLVETPSLPSASPTASIPPSSPAAPVDFESVRSLLLDGNALAARDQLRALLPTLSDPLDRLQAERLLGDAHTRLVFSDEPMPEKVEHVVRPGENLGAIARRYGANLELIQRAHGIRGSLIRPGDRLRILTGKFRVWVSKSRNELVVYHNDAFFKRYVVGTGTDGGTPAGRYAITLRMAQPVWYRPDGVAIPYGHPDNLLGTHYLKLNIPGIGLHGTWEPESVGTQSSAGCIRLLNAEIEELFLLLPEGTPVEIVE